MPILDKSAYKVGTFIVGDDYWTELMTSSAVIYGAPLPSTDLAEIGKRLDAAKKRLEEIKAAVRKR